MTATNKRNLTLRLTPTNDSFVRTLAEERECNVTDVITEAIEEYRRRARIEKIIRDSIKKNRKKFATPEEWYRSEESNTANIIAGLEETDENYYVIAQTYYLFSLWTADGDETEKGFVQFLKEEVQSSHFYVEPKPRKKNHAANPGRPTA